MYMISLQAVSFLPCVWRRPRLRLCILGEAQPSSTSLSEDDDGMYNGTIAKQVLSCAGGNVYAWQFFTRYKGWGKPGSEKKNEIYSGICYGNTHIFSNVNE